MSRAAAGRRRALLLAAPLALALGGCAQIRRLVQRPPAAGAQWSGRLSLRVEAQRAENFSAAFDLSGSPERGELALATPLGNRLALLSWSPSEARLRTGGQERAFASIDAMTQEVVGAPVPLPALFDWLAGRNTPVPGWQADLSQPGRIIARRSAPLPPVDLRVVLER